MSENQDVQELPPDFIINLQQHNSQLERALEEKENFRKLWKILMLVCVAFILFQKVRPADEWFPETDGPKMILKKHRFLRSETHECQWKNIEGAPGWYTKDESGRWHQVVVDISDFNL